MMKVVVVTGGIGSGKSLVCRMLAEKGIPVYEADKIGKRRVGKECRDGCRSRWSPYH